jgi:urea transport system permease protein
MTPDKSLEAVVWVAVGGRGTLAGPVLGAVVVNALKSWATRAIPDLWLILLGGLFLLFVLFLPGGLVSLPNKLRELRSRLGKKSPDTTPTAAPNASAS